ncbi:MAG: hypothetical protein MUQ27_00325 [Acidimicrobiia bacterium]|nr:hypothetical protein [Acidimicrobiia bacterium]
MSEPTAEAFAEHFHETPNIQDAGPDLQPPIRRVTRPPNACGCSRSGPS